MRKEVEEIAASQKQMVPGYGSFNNYLYCEEHGMKKYMKFTMYEKESKDKK